MGCMSDECSQGVVRDHAREGDVEGLETRVSLDEGNHVDVSDHEALVVMV